MNLIAGEYVNDQESLEILNHLEERIEQTLSTEPMPVNALLMLAIVWQRK